MVTETKKQTIQEEVVTFPVWTEEEIEDFYLQQTSNVPGG